MSEQLCECDLCHDLFPVSLLTIEGSQCLCEKCGDSIVQKVNDVQSISSPSDMAAIAQELHLRELLGFNK